MDTGWLYGSDARNLNVGSENWLDPQDAKTVGNDEAHCYIVDASDWYSDRLNVYNFGATIPDNAIINGIYYGINRRYNTGIVFDSEVYLMNDTIPKGNNKSTGSGWLANLTYKYFGGDSDLWGASWIPAQINASAFGLVIKFLSGERYRSGRVDVLCVKVYYTLSENDHLMMMGM